MSHMHSRERVANEAGSEEMRAKIQELSKLLKLKEIKLSQTQDSLNHLQFVSKENQASQEQTIQSLRQKCELQQQEINILAQGFQAQQVKLSQYTTKTACSPEPIEQMKTGVWAQHSALRADNLTQRKSPMGSQEHTPRDQEALVNHQSLIHIQQSDSAGSVDE